MKKLSLFFLSFILFNSIFSQELEELSFYPINGVVALDIKYNHLFLGSGEIIDLSNPLDPVLISQIPGVYSASIRVFGDYTYYGGEMSNKLSIADISNLDFPLTLSTYQFNDGHGIFGMEKVNDILYLAKGSNGPSDGVFISMDITDKSNPIILQTLILPGGQCRGVAVKDQYAYVATFDGLKIVDITDPSNMESISSIGGSYCAISIENNSVCMGKMGGGVDIFDISEPTSPSPLLAIPNTDGNAYAVYLINNYLYLAQEMGGIYIYQINGSNYNLIDNYYEVYGQTFDIAVSDSIIAVPGLIEGVSILAFDTLNLVNTKEIENQYTLTLSPNPCKQYITINSPDHSIESLKIQNLKGELIDEFFNVTSHHPIDLSFLSSGLYMISIRTSDILQIEKIIKI